MFNTKTNYYSAYFCGGRKLKLKLDIPVTAAQCMNYAFDLGADSVVFGVKTVDELRRNIQYYELEKETKNYGEILKKFKESIL